MISVGFTGTQKGMTDRQKNCFREIIHLLIKMHKLVVFHHGDCLGSDAEAHDIVRGNFRHNLDVVIHPPVSDTKRAFCSGGSFRTPEPYLERNHSIVDETDILIATPKTKNEEIRSGTWATIRYAYKKKKLVHILYP